MFRHLYRRLPLFAPDETGGGTPSPASGGGSAAPSPGAEPAAPSPAATPGGGEGATPAPSPAPAMRTTAIGDIPEDIMSLFDGTPVSEPVQAQPGQTPPAAQPPGSQPPAVEPGAPGAPQPGGPQVPQGPSAEALAAQISTLTDIVSRQAQGPAPAAGPQPPEVALPDHGYQFSIPEGLDTALVSDDPATRRTALQALIQGTSRTVHTEVIKSMRQEFSRILPQIVNSMITQSRSQQSVAQDFYGKFQQFSNPVFRPLVQQIGMQVAREMGAQGWTPELRDAIGARVTQVLQSAGFQAPGGAPQAPAPSLNGPAAIVPGGARPASNSHDPTAQFRELL